MIKGCIDAAPGSMAQGWKASAQRSKELQKGILVSFFRALAYPSITGFRVQGLGFYSVVWGCTILGLGS